jgi:hypothetical protein
MRILPLFLLLFICVACAARELVIKNADSMLEYQVNKRLPLTTAQKNELQKDVDLFLNTEKKIAKEILPVIDQINLLGPKEASSAYHKMEGFYRKISSDFSGLIAKYMVKLDEKQQVEFFENLKEESKKYGKKSQKERHEDAQERLERFVGDLSDEQKSILKSYDSFFKKQSLKRMERRKDLHERFKEILSGTQLPAEKEKSLQKVYMSHQEVTLRESKTPELIQKFIPTLSKDQREHFREKTMEVKEILRYFIQSSY